MAGKPHPRDQHPDGKFRPKNQASLRRRPKSRDYQNAIGKHATTTAVEQIVIALINQAQAGDTRSAETLFNRLLGKPGDRSFWEVLKEQKTFIMPPLNTVEDLTNAVQHIAVAVGQGELDETRARVLTSLINEQRRTLETTALSDRLDRLEQLLTGGGGIAQREGDRLVAQRTRELAAATVDNTPDDDDNTPDDTQGDDS